MKDFEIIGDGLSKKENTPPYRDMKKYIDELIDTELFHYGRNSRGKEKQKFPKTKRDRRPFLSNYGMLILLHFYAPPPNVLLRDLSRARLFYQGRGGQEYKDFKKYRDISVFTSPAITLYKNERDVYILFRGRDKRLDRLLDHLDEIHFYSFIEEKGYNRKNKRWSKYYKKRKIEQRERGEDTDTDEEEAPEEGQYALQYDNFKKAHQNFSRRLFGRIISSVRFYQAYEEGGGKDLLNFEKIDRLPDNLTDLLTEMKSKGYDSQDMEDDDDGERKVMEDDDDGERKEEVELEEEKEEVGAVGSYPTREEVASLPKNKMKEKYVEFYGKHKRANVAGGLTVDSIPFVFEYKMSKDDATRFIERWYMEGKYRVETYGPRSHLYINGSSNRRKELLKVAKELNISPNNDDEERKEEVDMVEEKEGDDVKNISVIKYEGDEYFVDEKQHTIEDIDSGDVIGFWVYFKDIDSSKGYPLLKKDMAVIQYEDNDESYYLLDNKNRVFDPNALFEYPFGRMDEKSGKIKKLPFQYKGEPTYWNPPEDMYDDMDRYRQIKMNNEIHYVKQNEPNKGRHYKLMDRKFRIINSEGKVVILRRRTAEEKEIYKMGREDVNVAQKKKKKYVFKKKKE